MPPRRNIEWDEDELAVLAANLDKTARQIQALLPLKPGRPQRTENAIARKRSMMFAGAYIPQVKIGAKSSWSDRDASESKGWGGVFKRMKPKK